MSQQKAASLTSSLFARKGRASPASMVISEIEGASPAQEPDAGGEDLHNLHEGSELKLSALALNGHAGRRRARTTEAELPLLAFVEAQLAAEEPAAPPAGAAAAAVPVEDPAPLAANNDEAMEQLPPAASLLDRGSRALGKVNGRRSAASGEVPSCSRPAATQVVEVPADDDMAAVLDAAPDAVPVAAPAQDGDRVTISGDSHVTAIEDAPEDSLADVSLGAEGETSDAPETEPAASAEVPPDVSAAPEAADGTDRVAAETPFDSGPHDAAPAEETAGKARAAEASADNSKAPPAPREAPPTVAVPAPGAAAVSSAIALREAAALRALRSDSAAKTAAVAPPPPRAERALPWRSAAVVALGAALGLGAYVMLSEQAQDGPVEVVIEATAPVAEDPAAALATAPETETVQTTALPEAAAVETAAPLPEPSFDIIRIEPDGQSIIAGRAVPFSEWILLNNGEPIASIRADAKGEWVVLPDASLVPGANAFSLVPKTEQGRVSIPAPGAPAAAEPAPKPKALSPRSDLQTDSQGEAASLAAVAAAPPGEPGIVLPKPKPEPQPQSFQVSAEGSYQVQVASVRQIEDAERERLRLTAAYPKLLGNLDLEVQEAAVGGAGTFYRVRSGALAHLGDAREVCRRLEEAGQGCLVVRRSTAAAQQSATPKPKPTELVEEETPPSHLPSRQQAERPQ